MTLLEYLFIHNLKASEFAKKYNLPINIINHLCSGQRLPTLRMAVTLVEITNGEVTYKDFFHARVAPYRYSSKPKDIDKRLYRFFPQYYDKTK